MRIGKVDEYIGILRKLTELPSYKRAASKREKTFLREVVHTYNNPAPSSSSILKDIVSQTVEQLANSNNKDSNNKDSGVAYFKKDSTITTK